MSFWPSDAWESNAIDVLKSSINPIKLIAWGATPISAMLGYIDWNQIPEVWDKIAADPTGELLGSAISGKLSANDADLVRAQLVAAGQRMGRTPQQIQTDLNLLNAYISAPVSKGGAGGTQTGLWDSLGQMIKDTTNHTTKGIWPVLGIGVLVLLMGMLLVEE